MIGALTFGIAAISGEIASREINMSCTVSASIRVTEVNRKINTNMNDAIDNIVVCKRRYPDIEPAARTPIAEISEIAIDGQVVMPSPIEIAYPKIAPESAEEIMGAIFWIGLKSGSNLPK